MRALILYHPKSDHVGLVEDYVQNYIRFKGRVIEQISLETMEGAELAKLYDVTSYPAALVIGSDGSLIQLWQNGLLPLMDELSAFAGSDDHSISHEGKKILAPSPQLHPI